MERNFGNNEGDAAAAKGAGASDSVPTSEAAEMANILAIAALMLQEEDSEDETIKKELAAALHDIREGTYGMGEDNQKPLTRRIADVGLAALGDDADSPRDDADSPRDDADSPLNADDFIAWLKIHRPVKCKPIGAERYWFMLLHDIEKGEYGPDHCHMPGLREDAREKVRAWVKAEAQKNARQ
jgi:hypothetical protein